MAGGAAPPPPPPAQEAPCCLLLRCQTPAQRSSLPSSAHSTEAANPRQAAWCRPLSSCTPAGLPPPPADGAAGAPGPSGPLAELLPPVVALGKFDALHRGHRALAEAAAELGGAPWLVSFSGIAEVLGWPARLPLVAPCDRRRVLASWAPHCLGRTPGECAIPFAEVCCVAMGFKGRPGEGGLQGNCAAAPAALPSLSTPCPPLLPPRAPAAILPMLLRCAP